MFKFVVNFQKTKKYRLFYMSVCRILHQPFLAEVFESGDCSFTITVSFAQWRYHSRWGLTEAWLLLVENYSQYPALTTLVVGKRNF